MKYVVFVTVGSEAESIRVQKAMFNIGLGWYATGRDISCTNHSRIFVAAADHAMLVGGDTTGVPEMSIHGDMV